MQRKQSIIKYTQNNHFGRYLKLLKSFDIQQQFKRKKFINAIDHKQVLPNVRLQNILPQKIQLPKTTDLHLNPTKRFDNNFNRKLSQISNRSMSTDLESRLNDSKLYLITKQKKQNRQIDQKFLIDNKKQLKSTKRSKTQPRGPVQTRFPKIVFNRLRGVTSGNLLEYSRMKPTQKYFSTLQNVKLAQRLLMAQPSKVLKRTQHKKFYQQQKTYRNQISQSILMRKNIKNMPLLKLNKITKKNSHKRNRTEWIG